MHLETTIFQFANDSRFKLCFCDIKEMKPVLLSVAAITKTIYTVNLKQWVLWAIVQNLTVSKRTFKVIHILYNVLCDSNISCKKVVTFTVPLGWLVGPKQQKQSPRGRYILKNSCSDNCKFEKSVLLFAVKIPEDTRAGFYNFTIQAFSMHFYRKINSLTRILYLFKCLKVHCQV